MGLPPTTGVGAERTEHQVWESAIPVSDKASALPSRDGTSPAHAATTLICPLMFPRGQFHITPDSAGLDLYPTPSPKFSFHTTHFLCLVFHIPQPRWAQTLQTLWSYPLKDHHRDSDPYPLKTQQPPLGILNSQGWCQPPPTHAWWCHGHLWWTLAAQGTREKALQDPFSQPLPKSFQHSLSPMPGPASCWIIGTDRRHSSTLRSSGRRHSSRFQRALSSSGKTGRRS